MSSDDASDHEIGEATLQELADALDDMKKEESLQPLDSSDAPPPVDTASNNELIDSTFSAAENVEQRIQETHLESQFSLLRIQNGRSNLQLLPPETLVEIALAYIAEVLGCCAGYDCTGHEGGWIEHSRARLCEILILSQIFSCLRDIYLGTPLLWSYIELSWNPAIIEVFSERSRSLPLSLALKAKESHNCSHYSANEFASLVDFNISFLKSNIQRIENLQIVVFTGGIDVVKLWAGFKDMPAPKLKKFTFDVALNLPSRARRFLPLQNLFSDRAPNLSKLKVCLANCKEFQPKSCTALVSLALTIKAKSAILNIWDVLSQTPLLKELTLEGDGRKHRLDGKPRPDRVLLSVLEFPALTELMISSEAYVADDGAIVSIFSPSHLPPIIKSLVSSTSELDLEIYDNMIGFIVPFRAISHIPDKCPQPFTAIRETVYDVPYVRTEECKLAFIDCVFHALKMKPEILYLDGWNPDDEWKSYEDDDVEVTQAKENLDVQEKKPKRVATFTEAVWNAILSGCPSVTKMDLQRTLPLWPFIDDLDQPTIKCPSLKQLNISIHPDDFDHRSFDRMLENRKARDAGIDEVELDIDVFDY